MKSQLCCTAVCGILLSQCVHANGFSHREVVHGDSIEWRVADADAIVRAKVEKVESTSGEHGLIIEDATLTVLETLIGEVPDTLPYSAELYTSGGWEVFDRPSRWEADNVELLIFLKGGKIKSLLRLDGEKSHGRGHRAFKLDMTVCKTKNSILASVYSALAFEEANRKPEQTILIDVPPGAEFWSELYGGSAVYLVVPVDERVMNALDEWEQGSGTGLNHAYLKQQVPDLRKIIEQQERDK